MKGDKALEAQEKAFRLMEALSEVDEELLARSEEPGQIRKASKNSVNGGLGKGRRNFPARYRKAFAACFAFLVLGLSFLGARRLWFQDKGGGWDEARTTASGMASDLSAGMAGGGGQGADSVMQEGSDGEEKAQEDAGVLDVPSEMEAKQELALVPSSGEVQEKAGQELDRFDTGAMADGGIMERDSESGVSSMQWESAASMKDALTLGEAGELAVLGEYVPDVPEGYRFASGELLSGEEAAYLEIRLVFEKIGSDEKIVLRLTDYCRGEDGPAENVGEEIDGLWPEDREDRICISADQLTAADFEDNGVVAVIYGDGVVIECRGSARAEVIYKMISSLGN